MKSPRMVTHITTFVNTITFPITAALDLSRGSKRKIKIDKLMTVNMENTMNRVLGAV